jgi:pimeloyl-ACP methyl ester carboxylesterase
VAAAIVSALAVAALALPASQAMAARAVPTASVAHTSSADKPTIVLVHGAFADSSSWDGVISRLQRDGYTVVAPPNPLVGLPYDSAYIRDFLSTISGPVVLVGHSYGGMVITNAATGDANVKALVYVDAFIPAQGQTAGELINAVPGTCVAAPNLAAVPYPGAPSGSVEDYITASAWPWCFANGLSAAEAAQTEAVQRPLPSVALTQPSGVPAWKSIPSWAVVGTMDHAIPPAELLAMAETAGARVTKVDAGHLSMVADPGVVTRVILQAVKATT